MQQPDTTACMAGTTSCELWLALGGKRKTGLPPSTCSAPTTRSLKTAEIFWPGLFILDHKLRQIK